MKARTNSLRLKLHGGAGFLRALWYLAVICRAIGRSSSDVGKARWASCREGSEGLATAAIYL